MQSTDEQLIDYLIPSRVRRSVLSSLLLDGRDWHPRELARVLGLSNSAVALELHQLRVHGLALRQRVGNQSRYRANPDCPVYAELRSLLVKTAGVSDRIRAALAPLLQAGQLDFAYVFGSFAAGRQRSGSDVDVMVVGRAGPDTVIAALATVEDELRREVNATVYTPLEYRQQLLLGRGFIHKVHTGPRIMLVGALDEPA